jgi:hypothetical protein
MSLRSVRVAWAKLLFGASAAVISAGLSACSSTAPAENIEGTEAAWGHMSQGLAPTSAQFLINKKRGASYRVCLASYMKDDFPGIESELHAAINIWASYLERSVQVEITTVDLPRAKAEQSLDDVSKDYHARCGDAEVVVGTARLDGDTMGITGGAGTVDRQGRWLTFKRFVFLRDFQLAPDSVNGAPSQWVSFEKRAGAPIDAAGLLAMMRERSVTHYGFAGTRMTLPVLTHEFGHAWGMCDQYENSSNCDARNATSHLATESVMGAATVKEPVYLTDDDIAGIRALGARPGFEHDWGATPNTPAPEIKRADVALFRAERISREGSGLLFHYGVVTSKPTREKVFVRAHGSARWKEFLPMFSEQWQDSPLRRLTLPATAGPDARYEVRLELSVKGDDGEYYAPRIIELTEPLPPA